MATTQDRRYREMALRGKYGRLYSHLSSLPAREWRTTFREIEGVVGFDLPPSARLYRPWWANQTKGNGHSQALAWNVAGWETAEVDMASETLLFRRRCMETKRNLSLDELWPVHPSAVWPEGLSLRREDIYEYRD